MDYKAVREEEDGKKVLIDLPPSFEAFLILSRLSDYGINLSVSDFEKLNPKLLHEWQQVMSILKPSDVKCTIPGL